MYLGIDVGGTKTVVAALTNEGVISTQVKFPTPKKYDELIKLLPEKIAELGAHDYVACGIGVPGTIDRKRGIAVRFGNLDWKNVPFAADLEKITRVPVALENDAKLAGLSEAMVRKKVSKLLYITISTGIGVALVVDREINTGFGDRGGDAMLYQHNGKLQPWEDFASGKALVRHYGKRAEDVTDPAVWEAMARSWRPGFLELIALTEPDVVVIGGGVGTHYKSYGDILRAELEKYATPIFAIPPIEGAKRSELAVVYGAYDLAKQTFGGAKKHA